MSLMPKMALNSEQQSYLNYLYIQLSSPLFSALSLPYFPFSALGHFREAWSLARAKRAEGSRLPFPSAYSPTSDHRLSTELEYGS
jgi:hypothetical protein